MVDASYNKELLLFKRLAYLVIIVNRQQGNVFDGVHELYVYCVCFQYGLSKIFNFIFYQRL